MIYGLLAEFVLTLHLAFVIFVIIGGLANVFWRKAWMIHLPALLWAFVVEFLMMECPLTDLENYFRTAAGQKGYSSGFLDHFISTLLYPGLPPEAHMFLGFLLAAINLAIYGYLFRSGSVSFHRSTYET